MRITHIERHGEHGWAWTEDHSTDEYPDHVVRRRTDTRGEGCWRWSGQQWTQELGHLQYRINATDEQAARAQIQHRWLRTHTDVATPEDYADARETG